MLVERFGAPLLCASSQKLAFPQARAQGKRLTKQQDFQGSLRAGGPTRASSSSQLGMALTQATFFARDSNLKHHSGMGMALLVHETPMAPGRQNDLHKSFKSFSLFSCSGWCGKRCGFWFHDLHVGREVNWSWRCLVEVCVSVCVCQCTLHLHMPGTTRPSKVKTLTHGE